MKEIILDEIPSALIERYAGTTEEFGENIRRRVRLNGVDFDEYAHALRELGRRTEESLALYIHLPFCPVRCHYCACNTNITHDGEKIDAYLETLGREMDLVVERIGRGRAVRQLHVGGGTPNYLSDAQLAGLMEMLHARFHLVDGAAACIECNPRRASAGQLDLLYGLGFRRISFGVQDLSPAVQQAIGRVHSAAIVRDVCAMARDAGFENLNMDLVYGLPEQTQAEFARTLEQVVSMAPDRVRCFSYAHAPALRPNQFAVNAQALPGPGEKVALFRRAAQDLTAAGYAWIGVDCFARDTDEWSTAQAERRLRRNGIGYTAVPVDHLLALGTHGLGELGSLFVQNESQLAEWQGAVRAGRLPIAWGHRLNEADFRHRRAYEHLMCNLELPGSMAASIDRDQESLRRFLDDGLLERTADGIRVTPSGRFFLRDLCVRQAESLDWDSAQWRFPRAR